LNSILLCRDIFGGPSRPLICLAAQVAYFADTDGPASKSTVEGAVKALGQGAVASAEELEAIIDHFHDKFVERRVTEPELIAARVYTGPGAHSACRRAYFNVRACMRGQVRRVENAGGRCERVGHRLATCSMLACAL